MLIFINCLELILDKYFSSGASLVPKVGLPINTYEVNISFRLQFESRWQVHAGQTVGGRGGSKRQRLGSEREREILLFRHT